MSSRNGSRPAVCPSVRLAGWLAVSPPEMSKITFHRSLSLLRMSPERKPVNLPHSLHRPTPEVGPTEEGLKSS